MKEKEFVNRLAKGKRDLLQEFIDHLAQREISFCVIGGLAVNAYAEPVVRVDLAVVMTASEVEKLLLSLPSDYTVRKDKHSTNISSSFSDLRIQLQNDARYQHFIKRSSIRSVLGYEIPVASVEDVLQGKLWAYSDPERRPSKRQKDLADIMRLVESNPELTNTPVGQAAKSMMNPL